MKYPSDTQVAAVAARRVALPCVLLRAARVMRLGRHSLSRWLSAVAKTTKTIKDGDIVDDDYNGVGAPLGQDGSLIVGLPSLPSTPPGDDVEMVACSSRGCSRFCEAIRRAVCYHAAL